MQSLVFLTYFFKVMEEKPLKVRLDSLGKDLNAGILYSQIKTSGHIGPPKRRIEPENRRPTSINKQKGQKKF